MPTMSSSCSRYTGRREWPSVRICCERLLQRHVDPHRHDVGARHHHVVGGGLAQAQHVGDQRALLPVEFRLLARASAARPPPPAPVRRSTRAALCSGCAAEHLAQPVQQRCACAVAVAHARFHGLGTPQPVQDARLRQSPCAARRRDGGGRGRAGAARRAPPDARDDAPAGGRRPRPRGGPRRAPARISGRRARCRSARWWACCGRDGGRSAGAPSGRRPAPRCRARRRPGRRARPTARHAAPAGARPAPPR